LLVTFDMPPLALGTACPRLAMQPAGLAQVSHGIRQYATTSLGIRHEALGRLATRV
jgi:hypothetical protein